MLYENFEIFMKVVYCLNTDIFCVSLINIKF